LFVLNFLELSSLFRHYFYKRKWNITEEVIDYKDEIRFESQLKQVYPLVTYILKIKIKYGHDIIKIAFWVSFVQTG